MVDKIHMGERVPLSVDAAGSVQLPGVVDTISPAADPRTQGYAVKVRIDNPGDAIRPGMFARVSFPVDRQDERPRGPQQRAWSPRPGWTTCMRRRGGRGIGHRKIAVQTGIADEESTEITVGSHGGHARGHRGPELPERRRKGECRPLTGLFRATRASRTMPKAIAPPTTASGIATTRTCRTTNSALTRICAARKKPWPFMLQLMKPSATGLSSL